MYGLDRSWAVRAEGTGVRIACSNLLYAGMNTLVELREVHLSSATDPLAMLQKAIHAILSRFKDTLRVYEAAMGKRCWRRKWPPHSSRRVPPARYVASECGGRGGPLSSGGGAEGVPTDGGLPAPG